MEIRVHFTTGIAGLPPSWRRALLAPTIALAIALPAGCVGSTEPAVASVPAEKVPPKRENPVPTPKKHGPKYGVSPRIDPNAQKG